LEAVITVTTRVLCNDYIGPARLRLNMLEVASELKRVWHPWFKVLFVIRCDTCSLWAFLTVRTVSSQWR